jgi:hypothetical protein
MTIKNTRMNSLLNEIYIIEHYLEKKKSAIDMESRMNFIDLQEAQVFNLLKNRSAEEKILQDIMAKIESNIENLEKKSNVNNIAEISKMRGFERNFENTFKKEINVIKKSISELYNFYEKQKVLEDSAFASSLDYEQKKIIEIKNLLDMIVNSEKEIVEYIKEVDKLKINNSTNAVYFYLGFRIPANIKIQDPISRYDLEPFLKAYRAFEKELENTRINLKYANMSVDTMRSQFSSDFMFHKPEKRIYIVFVSTSTDSSKGGVASLLTFDEKVGFYAHELSHIVNYIKMSNRRILGFTFNYLISYAISIIPFDVPLATKASINYLRKVERDVDMGPIKKGLGYELAIGSKYFLKDSNASARVKKRYEQIYTPLEENIDLASAEYMKRASILKKKN